MPPPPPSTRNYSTPTTNHLPTSCRWSLIPIPNMYSQTKEQLVQMVTCDRTWKASTYSTYIAKSS